MKPIDISFAGGSIEVVMENGQKCTITEFAADEDPISYESLTVTNGEVNLNGLAIFWRAPNLVHVSITVLPYSKSAIWLLDLLKKSHIQGGADNNPTPIKDLQVKSITSSSPSINGEGNKKYTFANGRLFDGPPGPGSNSEGKGSSLTFHFALQDITEIPAIPGNDSEVI